MKTMGAMLTLLFMTGIAGRALAANCPNHLTQFRPQAGVTLPFNGVVGPNTGCLDLEGNNNILVASDLNFDGVLDLAVGVGTIKNPACAAASPGGFVVLQGLLNNRGGQAVNFQTFPQAVANSFIDSFNFFGLSGIGLAMTGGWQAGDLRPELALGYPPNGKFGGNGGGVFVLRNGYAAGVYNFSQLIQEIPYPAGVGGLCLQDGVFNKVNGLLDCPGAPPVLTLTNAQLASYTPFDATAATFGSLANTGRNDIAFVNGVAKTVFLLFNTGKIGPPPGALIFDLGQVGLPSVPDQVVVGDFNNDGVLDLVTLGAGPLGANKVLNPLMGKLAPGKASYVLQKQLSIPNSICGVVGQAATGDFNLDGNLDVAFTTNCGVYVLQGDGKFGFKEVFSNSPKLPSAAITVADFNGDGLPDLAVVSTAGMRGVYPFLNACQ